ncbi:SRPBCC family protein [Demequina maris]|uniref:SRPBCC family protein n=1 Tax=Demequina maris TaxID=1638982 RepID=UPI00078550D2|nr:SRPBCC domain-containing protein [Demequina maris]
MPGPLDVSVEREGLVPASAKDVWHALTEPELRVEVFTMVSQAVTEAGIPGEVGHVMQFTEKDAGSEPVVVRLTTVATDPYHRLVQERVGPDGVFTSTTFLSESEDGTLVRRVFHVYHSNPSIAERAMRRAISTFFSLGGTVRLKADIGDLIRHFS